MNLKAEINTVVGVVRDLSLRYGWQKAEEGVV